jgi:hypothetical protein
MNGRMDGQMNLWTVRRIQDERGDGQMNEWTDEWMDGWTDESVGC